MKPVLHEVAGKNKYCGPTAIATILGISTDDASKLIRVQSGKPAARGVSTLNLIRTLAAAGCKVSHIRGQWATKDQPTLAAWLKAGGLPRDRHVVVIHGNHFGTILGTRYLCSLTKRQTVGLKDIPKRRARVAEWLIVDRLPAAAPVVAKVMRAPDSERKFREKAKALAAKHGIEIEVVRDSGSIIVWGHPSVMDTDADPHDGDHYAEGWGDALTRVEEYVALAEKAEGKKS